MALVPRGAGVPALSVIVPARNEAACLGRCLESLVSQQGIAFEVIVVDDGSEDRTGKIAKSFPGVQVLEAGPLPGGWYGKSRAAWIGAQQARGQWLLFTDADTVHLPGSLVESVEEAQSERAALLSYSPAQEVHGFWVKAVMAVVFAELARQYVPKKVNDPGSPAAANGQFLLITRDAYDAVGGHAAVAGEVLEDVALAAAVKRSGRKIYFRFGGDRVRARMYRGFSQMIAGWTKNLARLFPSPLLLAAKRAAEFILIAGGVALALAGAAAGHRTLALVGLAVAGVTGAQFLARIRRAHFRWDANLAGTVGLPIFSFLVLRSFIYYHLRRRVSWKGRDYSVAPVAAGSGEAHGGAGRSNGLQERNGLSDAQS